MSRANGPESINGGAFGTDQPASTIIGGHQGTAPGFTRNLLGEFTVQENSWERAVMQEVIDSQLESSSEVDDTQIVAQIRQRVVSKKTADGGRESRAEDGYRSKSKPKSPPRRLQTSHDRSLL